MMENNKDFEPLKGLIAATFTPFDQDGQLNLDPVPRIVEHHAKCSINAPVSYTHLTLPTKA